jgi:hypothetical protein
VICTFPDLLVSHKQGYHKESIAILPGVSKPCLYRPY